MNTFFAFAAAMATSLTAWALLCPTFRIFVKVDRPIDKDLQPIEIRVKAGSAIDLIEIAGENIVLFQSAEPVLDEFGQASCWQRDETPALSSVSLVNQSLLNQEVAVFNFFVASDNSALRKNISVKASSSIFFWRTTKKHKMQ